MSSHLDIIGSVVIAGMIILNFAFFQGERQNSQVESVNKIVQQGDVTEVTSTLRHDIMKAGFGCDTLKILQSSARIFTFRCDLGNDGKIDTISYTFGDYSPNTVWTNTAELPLFRIVNGRKVQGADLGIVRGYFKYYRLDPTYKKLIETTAPADVKAITVGMRLKSSMSSEDGYQYSQNEFTITPKNLK
ncbi:MAG: hypothetical protein M5R41_06005 [Bacteroidia bacterium]|nr:hypothetical protein [Bacteroidia bacterium]